MESQEPHAGPSSSFVPIGLSSKELARIRAETLRPRLNITHPESDESQSQSPPSPVVSSQAGLRVATPSPTIRTVQSQFDRFRREIHQILVERLRSDAPPSYTEGNVQERVE